MILLKRKVLSYIFVFIYIIILGKRKMIFLRVKFIKIGYINFLYMLKVMLLNLENLFVNMLKSLIRGKVFIILKVVK